MEPKVFISVGSAGTAAQKEATDTIFRSLELAGLSPRQMEKNEWTAEQPLRGIRRVIEECQGIVVIAFTRYQFPTGTERQKDGSHKAIEDVKIPTVWNQIEAAMGYMRNLPLLVIAEKGLLSDGLIEGRYDWKVYWTDFTAAELASDAFLGYLQSWKQLVLSDERTAENGDGTSINQLIAGALSLIAILGTTVLLLIYAAKEIPNHLNTILISIVPLMIIGLAFVARASGLIKSGQMVSLFKFAGKKEDRTPD